MISLLKKWWHGRLQAEALWSARTPCEHCGAYCLSYDLFRTTCGWCKKESKQKP